MPRKRTSAAAEVPSAGDVSSPRPSPCPSFCEGDSQAPREYRWQQDDEVSHCPICGTKFSHTIRKHHCRQCGRIVCDECSPQRLRLPTLPHEGKVRVCTPCCAELGERQAIGFKEDLAAYDENIGLLRIAGAEMYKGTEIYKRVLMEFDAQASGDWSLVEEHFLDADTPLASFDIIKERVQKQWDDVQRSAIQQKVQQEELSEKCQDFVIRIDQAKTKLDEQNTRKAELTIVIAEVDSMQAQMDVLVREQTKLEEAVNNARKRVRELELRRKADQERHPRPPPSTSISTIGEPCGNEAFTIAVGQGNPCDAPSRLEGCRRACHIM